MQKPEFPVTVNELENIFDETLMNDSEFSTEDFYGMAKVGFDDLKDKLQKTTITITDALYALWNYNINLSIDNDMFIMTSYYFLAMTILINKKSYFDGIDSTLYNKLVSYTKNNYSEKISEYK